jgi:hypothetical protein
MMGTAHHPNSHVPIATLTVIPSPSTTLGVNSARDLHLVITPFTSAAV